MRAFHPAQIQQALQLDNFHAETPTGRPLRRPVARMADASALVLGLTLSDAGQSVTAG
ncbi:hypothetical protein Z950_2043 [Sulfitobacter mediterraneus KCTC 32188]|nr:hypothetical protein Z950_2043 [Sulfitobacter mediterraneus KCTC 32188]